MGADCKKEGQTANGLVSGQKGEKTSKLYGFRADWFDEEKTTSISSATDVQGRVLTGYRGGECNDQNGVNARQASGNTKMAR